MDILFIIIKCILIIISIKVIKKIFTYLKIKHSSIRRFIYNKKFQTAFYLLFALPIGFSITNYIYRIINYYDDTFVFKVGIIIYSILISILILTTITTRRQDHKIFNRFMIWLFIQSIFTQQPYYMLNRDIFNFGSIIVALNLYSLFMDRNKYWKLPLLLLFINIYIYIPIFIEYVIGKYKFH